MCILFIAINQHPKHPLIVAANRDEFYQRPTKSAFFWPKPLDILAGQDLQAGGTWLGVNKYGQFAALTNIRTLIDKDKQLTSRGELVPKALLDNIINEQWLVNNCHNYHPFNLIYQQDKRFYCFNSLQKQSIILTDGFHAICNGSLDDKWPKMSKGEQLLEQAIIQHQSLNIELLFQLLQDKSQAPDELLPDTGVGIDWERLLSSIFIESETYGTRSSALVFSHLNDTIDFIEQSYAPSGDIFNKRHFVLTSTI